MLVLLAGCHGQKSDDVASKTETRTAILNAGDGGFQPTPISSGPAPSLVAALGPSTTDSTQTRAHATSAAAAGVLIDIAAGAFLTGSTPGDPGREPALEPALVPATLSAFQIDALPYPNDPAQKPKVGVTQAEAASLCNQRGERLCTELEWERACKGDAGDMFASGASWDASCEADGASCASGAGVRGMGALPEHTASTFATSDNFVVKGSRSNAAGTDIVAAKRCAYRGKTDPATARNVGFRCCKGTANTVEVATIESRPTFRKTKMDAAQFTKIVAELPELSRLGEGLRFFELGDIANVTGRSGATHEGITFTPFPVLWSPELGTELLVATGRSKSASFVVALHVLPHDKYRVASSFVMLNDAAPVVLAYEPSNRKQLLWSACWGCAGEQGSISVREDHKAMIVQY